MASIWRWGSPTTPCSSGTPLSSIRCARWTVTPPASARSPGTARSNYPLVAAMRASSTMTFVRRAKWPRSWATRWRCAGSSGRQAARWWPRVATITCSISGIIAFLPALPTALGTRRCIGWRRTLLPSRRWRGVHGSRVCSPAVAVVLIAASASGTRGQAPAWIRWTLSPRYVLCSGRRTTRRSCQRMASRTTSSSCGSTPRW
mmetsp:Transcript_5555/g.14682  ORF Transcript_5555/g.14682 Transcript_5555/m.14682 type:complete len:203 (+) Transcript_5555:778-1386(+)